MSVADATSGAVDVTLPAPGAYYIAVGAAEGGAPTASYRVRLDLAYVGALFLLAGIMTMLSIPHPWWMWVGGILALAGCSYLGARLAAAQTGITR